jgi:hypothetical protein
MPPRVATYQQNTRSTRGGSSYHVAVKPWGDRPCKRSLAWQHGRVQVAAAAPLASATPKDIGADADDVQTQQGKHECKFEDLGVDRRLKACLQTA